MENHLFTNKIVNWSGTWEEIQSDWSLQESEKDARKQKWHNQGTQTETE